MAEIVIREVDGDVVFTVKVVPGASRTGVCGLLDGKMKIQLSAAPEKGKANQCLIEFLAKRLGVKKNAVSIVSGWSSPLKSVKVSGISAETLAEKFNLK
jgi:uncharacterized protein (TIGR00251 family)